MSNPSDSLDRLRELGARTTASDPLTWEEARRRLGMDEEVFRLAWPAFYGVVAMEVPGSSAPPAMGLSPLRPEPGHMALLFPTGVETTRPTAVVLRDPWEVVQLDETKLAPLLDQIAAAGATFNQQLRHWARNRMPRPLPDNLLAAGFDYRDAFLSLARPVFHLAGRKVEFSRPLLPPRLNVDVADEMLLAQVRIELEKLQRTIKRGEVEFWQSVDVQDATIKRLATIGEAARQLSDGFRDRHPLVPWSQLIGLRNVLDHNLEGGPNLGLLWDACVAEVPGIVEALKGS